MGKLGYQFNSWIRYRCSAVNVHHLHSPFAYELVDKVINDRHSYPAYLEVNRVRKSMRKDSTLIEVTDFGAGFGANGETLSQKSVSTILKNNSIRSKYGQLLYRLTGHLQPEVMLELGTSLGISAAYLALGSPKATLVTLEGCSGIARVAGETFRQLGLHTIRQETGNFDQILEPVLEKLPTIDLAFIDGNHRKEPTLRYFGQCLSKSHNDTVLIFDDIHWSPEMTAAWNEISNHPKVTLTLDLFQFGIVFFRKELSKQDFIISY